MTQGQKESATNYICNVVIIVVTALVTGAITWGANHQRIAYVEREVIELRPVLMRIDRTLSMMEQRGRDMERRLDRLE